MHAPRTQPPLAARSVTDAVAAAAAARCRGTRAAWGTALGTFLADAATQIHHTLTEKKHAGRGRGRERPAGGSCPLHGVTGTGSRRQVAMDGLPAVLVVVEVGGELLRVAACLTAAWPSALSPSFFYVHDENETYDCAGTAPAMTRLHQRAAGSQRSTARHQVREWRGRQQRLRSAAAWSSLTPDCTPQLRLVVAWAA